MPEVTGWLWIGIGLVVIAVVILIILLARKQHAKDLASLTAEEIDLHERCVQADKEVREAEREYRARVASAEKRVKAATKVEAVSRSDGFVVSPLEITIKGKKHPMATDVVATLDAEGDITGFLAQRSTITRMATGAVLFGTAGAIAGGVAKKSQIKTLDTRELFVMVAGEGWAEVSKVPANAGEAARQFVASVNSCAQNYEKFKASYDHSVAEAQAALAAAKADLSAVESVRTAREALGADPLEEVRAARRTRARPDGLS